MTITRRSFLKQVSTAGLLTAAGCTLPGPGKKSPSGKGRRRKPNIIHIMSDELGYYELSCMGHPHFRTPNIDRLAAEGVRFTQGLAGAPLCAPTRCTLMTGKHNGHTSVRTNGGGTPMRAGEVTVATVLKKAGYATGGFGKWGCGGRGSTGVPEKHGFDVFFGYYDQVHAHTYYPPYLIRNSEEVPLPGDHGGFTGKTYSHYVIMDEAKKFIRANKDRPFYCYLPITPPHGLFTIPEDDPSWKIYKDKPWPKDAKAYAAMVNMVDRNVGEIRKLLAELGLEEDTIIFFSGDNGGMDYFRDKNHPRGFHAPNVNPRTGVAFRGQKGNLYEGGLRIPMIVCWPGRIRPGRVSDFLWYFPDFLATAAELAGVPPTPDTDGISIVPELLGEAAAGRSQKEHEFLYFELGGQRAVRMKNWKAVRPGRHAPWELYDLAEDIEEKHDLAEKHPEILKRMIAVAEREHVPAVEGKYFDHSLEEKDRAAKWGGKNGALRHRRIHKMPKKGLVPSSKFKILRVSSEEESNGKLAKNAIDGDPATWWHTRFSVNLAKPPHEIVIDMGAEHTVTGIRYLARQDGSWNGAFRTVRIYVGNDPNRFGKAVARKNFKKTRKPQEIDFAPVKGRYVRIQILSSINNGPWASAAEIGIVGK